VLAKLYGMGSADLDAQDPGRARPAQHTAPVNLDECSHARTNWKRTQVSTPATHPHCAGILCSSGTVSRSVPVVGWVEGGRAYAEGLAPMTRTVLYYCNNLALLLPDPDPRPSILSAQYRHQSMGIGYSFFSCQYCRVFSPGVSTATTSSVQYLCAKTESCTIKVYGVYLSIDPMCEQLTHPQRHAIP
jgi:hypothetical protein